MNFSTAFEWLEWMRSLNAREIDLGLERVHEVANHLGLLPFDCPSIVVAGTNGKGSTVAGLESIYLATGYKVGAYTSPMLLRHNDQVRINQQEVSDAEFCEAFAKVEAVRQNVALTYFEFFTLATLLIFKKYSLDVLILEIGLGGRLDAVNIIDSDVAIITSIGLDHTDRLGNTREAIAIEKAGILRANAKAVCGDINPPHTLLEIAQSLNTQLFILNKGFFYTEEKNFWNWQFKNIHYQRLPRNGLLTQNMAAVLMTVSLLQDVLPVDLNKIKLGLSQVKISGRIEIVPGAITEIHDVAHNPDAIEKLRNYLKQNPLEKNKKTLAVFSMLQDKDISQCIQIIKNDIDQWYIAELPVQRSASASLLNNIFKKFKVEFELFHSIKEAYQQSKKIANPGDRIIAFGSFHVLAAIKAPAQS